MARTITIEIPAAEAEAFEAEVKHLFAEIEASQARMRDYQEEIEASKKRTQAILDELRTFSFKRP